MIDPNYYNNALRKAETELQTAKSELTALEDSLASLVPDSEEYRQVQQRIVEQRQEVAEWQEQYDDVLQQDRQVKEHNAVTLARAEDATEDTSTHQLLNQQSLLIFAVVACALLLILSYLIVKK